MIRRLVVPVACLALAAVFVAAAVPKLLDPAAFALAIYRYQILPDWLVNVTAIYLPWLELSAALMLLLPKHRDAAAWILALLLLVFTAAIVSAIVRGLDVACGCFTTDPRAGRAGWLNVARNVGLLVLCALAARPIRRRDG